MGANIRNGMSRHTRTHWLVGLVASSIVTASCSGTPPVTPGTHAPSPTVSISESDGPTATGDLAPTADEVVTAYRVATSPVEERAAGQSAEQIAALGLPREIAPDSAAADHFAGVQRLVQSDEGIYFHRTFHDIGLVGTPALVGAGRASAVVCAAYTTEPRLPPDGERYVSPLEEGLDLQDDGVARYQREEVDLRQVGDIWAVASTTTLARDLPQDQSELEAVLAAEGGCLPDPVFATVESQWRGYLAVQARRIEEGFAGSLAVTEASRYAVAGLAELFREPLDMTAIEGLDRIVQSDVATLLTVLDAEWPGRVDVVWCTDPSLNPAAGFYYDDGTFDAAEPSAARGTFILEGGAWLLQETSPVDAADPDELELVPDDCPVA